MKNWILAVLAFVLLIGSGPAIVGQGDVITDRKSFLREFIKALEANDRARMEELVRQAGPVAYQTVLLLSNAGITTIAEGKDGAGYLTAAEAVAAIYGRVFEKEALLQLVRTYRRYTQELCSEKLKGDHLVDEGISLWEKARWQEALKVSKEALTIFGRLRELAGEAKSLTNLGTVCGSLGQYNEALSHHQQSLEICQKIGDVAGEAKTLGNLGNVYFSLGRYPEAMKHYQQSLEIFRKIGDVAGETRALNNIGIVYSDLAQYEHAVPPFQESLQISQLLGDLENLWRSHLGLGRALWKSGRGEQAVPSYQQAVEAIEQLYFSTRGLKEERSSMIGEKAFVYQEFLELLLELHRKSPQKGYDRQAFTLSERAKSRTFQELMAKAGAKISFAGEEAFQNLVQREQELIGQVSQLRTLITQALSQPQEKRSEEAVQSLRGELKKAEASLADLEKEIDARYPRYADLKRPQPLCVEELQKILQPEETLLSYALGKEKLVAFLIGKDRFQLLELPVSREELVRLVPQFRIGLDRRRMPDGSVQPLSQLEFADLQQFDPRVSFALYQKLFAPLAPSSRG